MLTPAPPPPAAAPAWAQLLGPPVAHRGLWDPKGAPENSLAAFEAAVDAGYGVELDVRLSADGAVMVFHDAGLERMVGRQGALADHDAAELAAMRLRGGREAIPTLRQVLDRVEGRALILVELKTGPGEEGPLDEAVAALADAYAGPLAVIGFNPLSHAWWATHRPDVLRGLDSYLYTDAAGLRLPDEMRRSLQALEHMKIARPHFLALSTDMLTTGPALDARAAGYPIIAWTVRSPEQAQAVAGLCDNLIFEGFAA